MSILLVGAGPIAIAYARVLAAMGRSFITVGRSDSSAERFAAQTGVMPLTGGLAGHVSGGAMASVTHAVVAVPIPELARAVALLVDHGIKNILVEKPAGASRAEISALAREVRLSGASIFVAYNRRYFASTAAARQLIEEDGGVTSFHVEFTERVARMKLEAWSPTVLANWFFANSSHVVDLAFHLGGRPCELSGSVQGGLDWHPSGAVFHGSGRTLNGATFTWHANWLSGGNWGIDLRTRRRRIVMQPLESIQIQGPLDNALQPMIIDDSRDRDFKPGFYGQVSAFLSERPGETHLLPLAEHARAVEAEYAAILGGARNFVVDPDTVHAKRGEERVAAVKGP